MKTALIAGLAIAFPALAVAAVPLEIKYAPADTVTSAKLNIIAVTVPGAKATINGVDTHVYNTGSFGMPVELAPGKNTIEISVSTGYDSTARTISVFRKEAAPKPGKKEAPRGDMLYSAPFTAVTLPNAFLVYGNGDDRLGGSKMGFINEGIPLKISGENGDLYKVQLSANRYAYIEKEYVDKGEVTDLSPVNTGTWSITNQGKSDRITVSLPRRLPFRSWTLLEPNTICIELFGAMDNSNWITQHGPLGIIDYTYFEQTESDVYKIVIRLKDKYCWGYSIAYSESGALQIDVRHKPSTDLKDMVIGLDAGHGGTSSGAVSPSGLKESDLNLDIIFRLKALLEKAGAEVVMTRDDDISLSMAARKKIWKDGNIDLAISVHNNASGSPYTPMGTSVYYKHLFDRPLAECMHKRMLELGVADFGLTGNFNFSLNGPTDYPNVLIEGLFMSNLAEEEMLADPEIRQKIAGKIFEGLKDYLKQASK